MWAPPSYDVLAGAPQGPTLHAACVFELWRADDAGDGKGPNSDLRPLDGLAELSPGGAQSSFCGA